MGKGVKQSLVPVKWELGLLLFMERRHYVIINGPGVAGAVLQTPLLLINSLIN